jgi:hypothetical protein
MGIKQSPDFAQEVIEDIFGTCKTSKYILTHWNLGTKLGASPKYCG